MQFGRLMVYRSLSSKLMQIGAPVWAGVSLEAGKVYNSSGSQNSGWKQAYGLFLGADTWIGPIYLVVGKTSGGSKRSTSPGVISSKRFSAERPGF